MENFGRKTATTINGVVINIHGDTHTTTSKMASVATTGTTGPDPGIPGSSGGKKIRRDASFRVPPPPSYNGGSGRASSPTLSSASGSPYPAPIHR